MAHNKGGGRPGFVAASAIPQYAPVMFLAGGSALSETVKIVASQNDFPIGVTLATAASPGDPVTVAAIGEEVKMIANASLGAGAFVAVTATTNGGVGPITPSGVASGGASVNLRYSVGIAMKNAAAGDYFPVLLKPDQIV